MLQLIGQPGHLHVVRIEPQIMRKHALCFVKAPARNVHILHKANTGLRAQGVKQAGFGKGAFGCRCPSVEGQYATEGRAKFCKGFTRSNIPLKPGAAHEPAGVPVPEIGICPNGRVGKSRFARVQLHNQPMRCKMRKHPFDRKALFNIKGMPVAVVVKNSLRKQGVNLHDPEYSAHADLSVLPDHELGFGGFSFCAHVVHIRLECRVIVAGRRHPETVPVQVANNIEVGFVGKGILRDDVDIASYASGIDHVGGYKASGIGPAEKHGVLFHGLGVERVRQRLFQGLKFLCNGIAAAQRVIPELPAEIMAVLLRPAGQANQTPVPRVLGEGYRHGQRDDNRQEGDIKPGIPGQERTCPGKEKDQPVADPEGKKAVRGYELNPLNEIIECITLRIGQHNEEKAHDEKAGCRENHPVLGAGIQCHAQFRPGPHQKARHEGCSWGNNHKCKEHIADGSGRGGIFRGNIRGRTESEHLAAEIHRGANKSSIEQREDAQQQGCHESIAGAPRPKGGDHVAAQALELLDQNDQGPDPQDNEHAGNEKLVIAGKFNAVKPGAKPGRHQEEAAREAQPDGDIQCIEFSFACLPRGKGKKAEEGGRQSELSSQALEVVADLGKEAGGKNIRRLQGFILFPGDGAQKPLPGARVAPVHGRITQV